jgi:hypothetical protein
MIMEEVVVMTMEEVVVMIMEEVVVMTTVIMMDQAREEEVKIQNHHQMKIHLPKHHLLHQTKLLIQLLLPNHQEKDHLQHVPKVKLALRLYLVLLHHARVKNVLLVVIV